MKKQMKKPGIVINSARCMACYACFMACKDEHCGWGSALTAPQPALGQFWMNIVEWERGDNERRIKTATVPTPCVHCDKPACAAAAKDGAVYKRADGVVIIDPEKAKGQQQIVDACPAKAVFWNEELSIAQKCTMCAELMDDPEYIGYEPRCVEACPNEALVYGDLADPEDPINTIYLKRGNVTPLECFGEMASSVIHMNIPTAFLAGTVFEPEENEEVIIGAHVKATCEDGTVYEMDTNWAGDWEFEDLPKNKKFKIEITAEGYKLATHEAFTDTDHYVAETYMVEA